MGPLINWPMMNWTHLDRGSFNFSMCARMKESFGKAGPTWSPFLSLPPSRTGKTAPKHLRGKDA